MENNICFKATKEIKFLGNSLISKDDLFYVSRAKVYILNDKGIILGLCNLDSNLSDFRKKEGIKEITTEEFNKFRTNLMMGFSVKSSTTEYQNISIAVTDESKFDVIDSQRHFSRDIPIHTESFNINQKEPIKDLTSNGEVSKFKHIPIPKGKEIKASNLGSILDENLPNNSPIKNMSIVPVEIPFIKNEKKSDIEKSWTEFSRKISYKQKEVYIISLSYDLVIDFFILKLQEVLNEENLGENKRINFSKYLDILKANGKQSRKELKA